MLNRRGRESPFSLEQDAHIESFFPALLAEPASTVASWKETTAQKILLSPLFAGKLPSQAEDNKKGTDEKGWKERIKKKFGNRLNAEGKRRKSPSTTAFLTFAPLSAKSLFEVESRPLLEAEAIEQVSKTKRKMAVCYPICVEERWNSLDEAKRTAYQMRADKTPQSVSTNQVDFPRAAQAALTALCRGGQVGKLELMTFWAYREPDGILRHGIIDAHASDDVPNMADTPAWEERAYELWQQFADKAVPSPFPALSIRIPRNTDGIPVFPTYDLQSQPPKSVCAIMTQYLTELWGVQWDEQAMPWNDLAQDGIYYDSQKFNLPFQLNTPESLGLPQLYGLAQYFSGRSSADPFVFRDQAEVARLLGNAPTHDAGTLSPNPTELEVEQTENNLGKPIEDVPTPGEVHVPNEVSKKRRGRPPKVQSDSKIPSPKKQKPNPIDSSSTSPERPKRVIPPKKSHVNHDSRAKVKPGFEIRLYAYDEKGNRGEEIREQRQPNHGNKD